uniref:Immunoglobulin domain-containing protein n=1 Tax=Terrapene triunguis TaxID=2587831 RepID=A0A674KB57_9SAUR
CSVSHAVSPGLRGNSGPCGKASRSPSPGPMAGGVSLGGAVTVRCWGQRWGMWFVLNKEGRHYPPVDSDGFGAVFPISNMSWEDGGSYSCSYHSRSEPFAASYRSDPVELVVRGEGPSISLSPAWVTAPGAEVTIRCQGQRRDVRFFLHKVGHLNPQQHMDSAGDGAEFRIPTVGRQHGGSYSCSYRLQSEPFVSSYPSSYVELTYYPKPSISLRPSGRGVALGGNITIQCQAPQQNMRFLLYKVGSSTTLEDVEPAGDVAEFPNSNVSWRDAGRDRCQYSTESDPPIWSHPGDPVELVVSGEGPGSVSLLPAPPPVSQFRARARDWGGVFFSGGGERKQQGKAGSSSSPIPPPELLVETARAERREQPAR